MCVKEPRSVDHRVVPIPTARFTWWSLAATQSIERQLKTLASPYLIHWGTTLDSCTKRRKSNQWPGFQNNLKVTKAVVNECQCDICERYTKFRNWYHLTCVLSTSWLNVRSCQELCIETGGREVAGLRLVAQLWELSNSRSTALTSEPTRLSWLWLLYWLQCSFLSNYSLDCWSE